MAFTFDPEKSAKNERERGLPFDLVGQLDLANARMVEDDRRDYGERRFQVFARREGRLHMFVFTPRDGDMHIISFRKASRKEERIYERETDRRSRTPG